VTVAFKADVDLLMAIVATALRMDASRRRRSGDLAMLTLHISVYSPRRGTRMEVTVTAQNGLGSAKTFLTDENGLVQSLLLSRAPKLAKQDLDRIRAI
jgi:hypothetical protein